jgi:nucleoporin NUP159
VFEASDICSPGDNEVSPLHTFLSTTTAPTAVRQMYANPGDIPELVAILREPDGSPNSQLVEIINVSTMQSVAGWSAGGTPETFPTSSSYNLPFSLGFSLSVFLIVSWSPKGKQVAIALQSGDIITFSPSETQQAKSVVARPASMQGQSIIHATWLSNSAFYIILAPAGPLDPQVDQKHMVIMHDAKRSDTSADVLLPINFFPSGVRPPGAFTIALRGWDPAKILLLVGDSTTADLGLVCCTTDDKWQKLSFDEGAPSMPLDADQNETTMIGFELDLKNTSPYDVTTSTGETVSVPPPPVVWAYANDGTVTAWYVVNTRGTPYPSMGQATTLPVSAPAASVPTSPFSQAGQPAFGQTSPPAFGQASVPGPTFGQRPTFGHPAFTQTPAGSTFGQSSTSGQAPSGEGFASFASAPVKWGQSNFGSTVSSFTSAAPPGSPPQIQPSESTESMSTDSGQELSFSGMSLGEGTNDTQPKAGSGMTGMFGSPAPVTQSAAPATTSAFGSGSFSLSPGIGAFSNFIPRQTGDAPNVPTVGVPKPSSAFGQTGFGAPAFGQSGFGQSAGQSAFGKTGLGTPMSTTPIVTPVSTTSPSFGSGGAFSAFASGGPATLSGSKPAETKLATPTMSGGGAFGSFASSGPSAFGQVASATAESVPAWKNSGDATFGSGTGSSVFGGKSSTSPLEPPTPSSLEKAAASSAGATPLTPPSDGATPSRGSQSPPDDPTAPTSPLTAADLSKATVSPESTTPAGPPPVPNAFMGLKMSTGFGLSNFSAKDSPFANPKPVSQTVSAFGGGQASGLKMPVPATPGSVFGQTSTIGTAAKAVSAFGQPAFGSPTTPTAAPTAAPDTTPSSSQTGSSSAFSAFSGTASAFGKTAGTGASFSEMLRHAGSSPDSKSKEPQAKASTETRPTPPTPKSVFDKSPTPRPASIPAAPESDDEGEGDNDRGKAPQVLSAESSFSNLSSSTSSFVDVPRGGEEEEEGAVASDGGDGDQQIDEFLSGTDSEGEGHEEEEEEEEPGEEGEEHEEDEEDGEVPSPTEAEPTAVPLPKSRSPSSTPKAERPVIAVQPIIPPKPEPDPDPEPELEPSTTSRVESTTPPGSPSTAPLQEPTPMLPSPSQTPSPSPSSASSSLGRPSTRPLRSSPLANVPVSGGDEEDVKGEKPSSLKPRPASPKTPFGKWDGSAKAPSPTPPPTILEPPVDQATKVVPPSLIPRPKSPPPLMAKGTPLNTSSLVTGQAATPPAPSSGWIGFSLGGSGPKPDTKSTAKPATTTTPSLFAGIKPEVGTEAPAAVTPSRTPGAASLITPPKETPSAEPMVPMQIEFAALYTEVLTEMAAVRRLPSFALCSCTFIAHVPVTLALS